MRTALLLSFVLMTPVISHAQTAPAPAPPKTAAPPQTQPRSGAPATAPAQPRARTTAPATAAGRSGMALTVVNAAGTPLEGVHVEVTGPMERTADTSMAGQVNFPGLPAGTYRLKFSGDNVIAFEREATLTGSKVTTLQITLNDAPAPRKEEPKAAVAPAPPAVGPVGSPQWGSLSDLAKRALASKPVRREVLLACSGNSRSVLLLLNEDQPQRVYDDAESTYYVMDGQGVVKIGDRPGDVTVGSFVSVPRGMPFTITRKSNKPLVLLWVLSGSRCEEAR